MRRVWSDGVVAGSRAAGFLAAVLLAAGPAWAQPAGKTSAPQIVDRCVLVVDVASGARVHRDGDCGARHAPESTFKVPLALMGFETGLLTGLHDPVWRYDGSFQAPQRDHKDVDPVIWERDSVVWFSRELVKRLAARDGASAFGAWVARLNYGNQDVSGDPGKNNGLTNAWLSSSLRISPEEQTTFIRRLLRDDLPASARAMQLTRDALPEFAASDGWTIHGKTGSSALAKTAGGRQGHGWFVGWARKDGRTLAFAVHETARNLSQGEYVGPRLRAETVRGFSGWLE
ncbi:beta-lactamase [Camelimonas fluminis]|uniref:Beta-lactamase n=2 Tax=Camelimonas fluminis TaxID=1576911 RepID=A0ABV7UD51_9HYPH|nr:class D beta-lactamase [Camelimonas fluminis]GHE46200.1 beta-lactamase [Camelimonas fluminis]